MKHTLSFLILSLTLAFVPANAQDKPKPTEVAASVPSKPADVPKPIVASVESQNAILKAEHELDTVKTDLADITQQFQNLQRAADQLNPRFKADQDKQKALEAGVTAALDAAYKANGVPKDKYNFDPANFTFTPKPEKPAEPKVAQAAAAPAK